MDSVLQHESAKEKFVKDKQLAMHALAGLPQQYDLVATVYKFTKKDLLLDELLPRHLAFEQSSQAACCTAKVAVQV